MQLAIVLSPKGIRIPAQRQASLRAPPWVAVERIARALKGHRNAMIAFRVKKMMPKLCIVGSIALTGQIHCF